MRLMDAAVQDFQGGVASFQQQLDALVASVSAERVALAEAQTQLASERKAYEEEKQRVSQVFSGNEQVVLNVGGVTFTTTHTTLQNAPAPSLFAAMFSGRHTLKPDQNGHYFIDRDGRHFHDILNYLRDGSFSYPPDGTDFKYLLELRAEAEYYGLTGLLQNIDKYPHMRCSGNIKPQVVLAWIDNGRCIGGYAGVALGKAFDVMHIMLRQALGHIHLASMLDWYALTRAQRAGSLNTDDSWMYEDGHDEIVFTVDQPCQLLGVGLCGTEGAYTVELELLEVEASNWQQEVAKLGDAAQSYTRSDGEVVRLMLAKPAQLEPKRCYMLSALIKGTESFCCEDCLQVVVAAGVRIHFQSYESPNGTTDQRGQFHELYIRAA